MRGSGMSPGRHRRPDTTSAAVANAPAASSEPIPRRRSLMPALARVAPSEQEASADGVLPSNRIERSGVRVARSEEVTESGRRKRRLAVEQIADVQEHPPLAAGRLEVVADPEVRRRGGADAGVVDVDARYPVTIAHRRADEVLLQIEAPRPDVVRCAQVRAPPRPRHLSRLIVQHAVDGRRRLLDVADQPPDAEAAARERASISGLDVDARDARLVDVEERVDDQRDRPELLTGIGRAARDALAERLDVVLEAAVDRSLHAERVDRAVHFDVEVVDRYAESRHGGRLIDDAEYASIGLLGIDARIAAGNLRRRVRRLSGEPSVRDVRARDRCVEALGERA